MHAFGVRTAEPCMAASSGDDVPTQLAALLGKGDALVIRKTDEVPPRALVVDLIAGGILNLHGKNDAFTFARLRRDDSEVGAACGTFKFKGRGRRARQWLVCARAWRYCCHVPKGPELQLRGFVHSHVLLWKRVGPEDGEEAVRRLLTGTQANTKHRGGAEKSASDSHAAMLAHTLVAPLVLCSLERFRYVLLTGPR